MCIRDRCKGSLIVKKYIFTDKKLLIGSVCFSILVTLSDIGIAFIIKTILDLGSNGTIKELKNVVIFSLMFVAVTYVISYIGRKFQALYIKKDVYKRQELTRFKILDLQYEDILPEEGKYENYIVNDSINNEDDEDLSLFDKAHKENIPINVDFHVTYKCNLRCKHCYAASQKENFYEQELTLEEIKKTFDQLDELGTFYLRITGGEPFIHPQFKEIIEYAYLKKFAVSIVTNGTLLSDDIIDDLKRFKIRTLTFSLHGGDANVHDACLLYTSY